MISHESNQRWQCGFCPKKYLAKKSWQNHVNSVHGEMKKDLERPFKCEKCGFCLTTKSNLNAHMKIHGSYQFNCSICNGKFKQRRDLKKHILGVHSDEKPFKCTLCEYKTKRSCDLDKHMRKHKKDHNFECEKCGLRLRYKESLKRHINIFHLDERNHECNFRNFRAKHQGSLRTHRKIHSKM